MRSLGCAALAACALWLGAAAEAAEPTGGMCGPALEPVLLVLLGPGASVASAAEGLSSAQRLVSTPDTVVYADGRAVTSNLDAMSRHLNALGWSSRPIEIVGAGTSRRASPGAGTGARRRRG